VADWIGAYEEFETHIRQLADVGGGVTVAVIHIDGRLEGSTGALGRLGHGVREFLSEWEDFRLVADSYHELDAERVLVLDHRTGRSRASGLSLETIRTDGARVFYVCDGTVRRLVVYFNREHALADLGLAE
jgi:hypothetical protein